MKKLCLILIILICKITSFSQTPDWLWAKCTGGSSNDEPYSVAVDALGNTYIAGYFQSDTITFDSITLTNADNSGNTYDIFLTKYDINGNVIWAKGIGGSSYDGASSVIVDASGNIYMAGIFLSPTITFDSISFINAGNSDIFLIKYDSNGNMLWVKSAGSSGHEGGCSIAVDSQENVYLSGIFTSATVTFGSTTLTNDDPSGSSEDIIIAKYDVNGNVLWAKSAGGSSHEWSNGVAIDSAKNIYVSGYFQSPTVDFDTITLTNTNSGTFEIFLVKYDNNGNALWAKNPSGTSHDDALFNTTDPWGNIYVTGFFQSPYLIFDTDTLMNSGSSDIFLAKYNTNGNVLWAKSIGSTNIEEGNSLVIDTTGNIFLAGNFESITINFDTTILTNTDGTGFSTDIFISKCDTNGNILWAESAGGTGYDYSNYLAVDLLGNAYLAGHFRSPVIIMGADTLTNKGSNDILLAKLASYAVVTTQTNVSCFGGNNGTANVNAMGGTPPYSYSWSTIPEQTTQTATGLAAGNYIVTVTDAHGAPSSAIVTISQPPALTIYSSNASICKGNDTTLCITVEGGVQPYQYLWNNDSTSFCQYVSPDSTTDYSVTITDANGCTEAATGISVVVNPLPTATILSNDSITICQGQYATLIANTDSDLSYQWQLNGANIIGATDTSYQAAQQGFYTVVVTNLFNCSTTSLPGFINVNPLPTETIIVNGSTFLCQGDSLLLTINYLSGSTYQWQINDTIINNATDTFLVVSQSGNYSIIITNENNCTATDNVIITVNPVPPTPIITYNGNILTSDAVIGNQWYKNDTILMGAINQTYPVQYNGNYYDIVTLNGCSSDTSNIITVTNAGINEISSNDYIIIYPNPVSNKLFIETAQKFSLEILYIQGQIIKTIYSISKETIIDLEDLSSGVYIVRAKSDKGIVTKKFIKE